MTWSTAAIASEFIILSAPEKIEVRETVSESAGTMSGAHSARIRANALIASLFLSKSETETTAQPGQFKIAPIVVPAVVEEMEENLRLCMNLNTINGHYKLIGYAEMAKVEKTGSATDLVALSFESEHAQTIGNRYGDSSFIGRSFIATACASSQTSYYMPVSFADDPDTLNITFEVTNGTVEAVLYAIGEDGVTAREGAEMTCRATRRLTKGFDCEVNLAGLFDTVDVEDYSGLVELGLTITDKQDTSYFATRISVPRP
ncbi:hypothetical protein [uncultured Roseobacter sp.]|uniref:hypothetical protein n=1 Tax=uncultured Roseobacter sp. TaxID=114847 RepID=UPI0026398288|nr:hypothetical protein [uncultured Roseobacter sp.]